MYWVVIQGVNKICCSAIIYLWAISSVSYLDIFPPSLDHPGIASKCSRSKSKASLSPCIRFLSLAFAWRRRLFSSDGWTRGVFLPFLSTGLSFTFDRSEQNRGFWLLLYRTAGNVREQSAPTYLQSPSSSFGFALEPWEKLQFTADSSFSSLMKYRVSSLSDNDLVFPKLASVIMYVL